MTPFLIRAEGSAIGSIVSQLSRSEEMDRRQSLRSTLHSGHLDRLMLTVRSLTFSHADLSPDESCRKVSLILPGASSVTTEK